MASSVINKRPDVDAYKEPRDVLRARGQNAASSYWDKALAELKQKHPKIHEQLKQYGTTSTLPDMITQSAKWKVKESIEKDGGTRKALRQGMKVITSLKDIVLPLSRLDPSGAATIACGAIFAIMQIALDDTKQYQFAVNSLVDISPIIRRWVHYENRIMPYTDLDRLPTTSKLGKSIVDLYGEIMFYLVTMATYSQKSNTGRFVEAMAQNLDEWKRQLELIKSKDIDCKAYRDEINEEKDIEKQDSEILQWIFPIGPSRKHQDVLNITKVAREYSQCGQWLLDSDEYEQWKRKDGGGSKVLWLCGTVGTGKTTLAARLIQDLQEYPPEPTRLVFHYCSGSQLSTEGIDYTPILRSIVRQMAWIPETSSTAEPVRKIHRQYSEPQSRDSTSTGSTLSADEYALDECEQPMLLLKYLHKATKSCKNVHFLFSRRANVLVSEYFGSALKVNISAEKSMEDMINFIHTDIESRNEQLLGGKHPDLKKELITLLSEKADGMFRWTQMQLEDFLSSSRSRPRLRTRKEFCDKLNNLRARTSNKSLEQEYDRMHRQNTLSDRNSRVHADRVYKILLGCFEPMSLNQLVQATATKEEWSDLGLNLETFGNYVLESCSNFILENNGLIQFAHPSAREWLESRESGQFGMLEQHVQLTLSSLHTVEHSCGQLLKYFKRWRESVSPAYFGLPKLADLPVELHFTFYATRFWARHASRIPSKDREKEKISIQIARFLHSADFRVWQILMLQMGHKIGNEIEDSLVSRDRLSDRPNPAFLISAFGFVECLDMPDYVKIGPNHDRNQWGDTALHVACRYAEVEVVMKLLINRGNHFDINAMNMLAFTPLATAVHSNSIETVSLLLKHGAITDSKVMEIPTPLHFAAHGDHLDIVQLLMQHIEKSCTPEQVLMMIASYYDGKFFQHVKDMFILEFLLGKVNAMFANSVLKERFGYLVDNALFEGGNTRDPLRKIQLLLKSGASLSTKDARGYTPLHHFRTPEYAQCLVRADPSLLSIRDSNGLTPLLEAFSDGKVKKWRTLIKLGGNIIDRTPDGQTGLHLCIRKYFMLDDCSVTMQFLIEQGLAGRKDHEGNIALHLLDQPLSFNLISWCSNLLRLLRAGETLLTTNKENRTVAEVIFGWPARRQHDFLSDREYQPHLYRIIIYFLEELRREEEIQSLNHVQRNRLRYLCHRFRKLTEFDDRKVEGMLKQDMAEDDKRLLGYLRRSARAWLVSADPQQLEGSFGGKRYVGHVPLAWTKSSKPRPPIEPLHDQHPPIPDSQISRRDFNPSHNDVTSGQSSSLRRASNLDSKKQLLSQLFPSVEPSAVEPSATKPARKS